MLSLVIPVYNEEKLIDELVSRTLSALDSFITEYEVIFVDDGSSDGSLEKLLSWQKKESRLKILSLSKNFGHQAAYTAGLEHAKGEVVAMMDGDLQDPPELLSGMYSMITEEGYDIVSGKKTGRKGRKDRNLFSFLFHILFRHIGEIKNMENSGNYSMMKREALDALLTLREKVRYLPGLRTFIGFRQGYIEFVRDDRFKGEPKMSIRKLNNPGCRCDILFLKVSDKILPCSGNNRNSCIYGSRHLCPDCKSLWICGNWMVINSSQYLFSRIHSAGIPGNPRRICLQKLQGISEPPHLFRKEVL